MDLESTLKVHTNLLKAWTFHETAFSEFHEKVEVIQLSERIFTKNISLIYLVFKKKNIYFVLEFLISNINMFCKK